MKIFFGAAIQGHANRGERVEVYQHILQVFGELGHHVYSEHTCGKSFEEVIALMDKAIGPLPNNAAERVIYVRNKMIEGVESDIDAAIFEVSMPSLGTGIELAHAYLRPRLGLKAIPVLALYQTDYWPNNVSTMIRGITSEQLPNFCLQEYQELSQVRNLVSEFLDRRVTRGRVSPS